MAEEVVSLCASGGHLSVTQLLSLTSSLPARIHLPDLSQVLPQLHFQGGSGTGCEEEKETQR